MVRWKIIGRPHMHKIFYSKQGILLCKNFVLKWFVDLIDLEEHTAKDKQAIWALESLSAIHAFDYMVLRVNPGLTSCEDLAATLISSTSVEVCNLYTFNKEQFSAFNVGYCIYNFIHNCAGSSQSYYWNCATKICKNATRAIT